jgi:dipeptidyl aminopeptidase/acylaminoacyl peptidase
MAKIIFSFLILIDSLGSHAQKKPLDHSVYDSWQSIGEKSISNDGNYFVYAINPQEGDGVLVIQTADGKYKREIARGYNATITGDSRFLICKIKPYFKDTREAKIKKKKQEEMPKDSLAILLLGRDSIIRIASIKSYKTPEKGSGWVAYQAEKTAENGKLKSQPDSISQLNNLTRMADSLDHIADSLRNKAAEAKEKGLVVLQSLKKENKKADGKTEEPVVEGTDLILRNLQTGEERKYILVSDYLFSKKGEKLVIGTTKKNNDSLSRAFVLLFNSASGKADTLLKGFNDIKNYAFDEDASQLAFVAERDSSAKSRRKFYKLYYYRDGMDSASLIADRNTAGVSKDLTISENYALSFSKNGNRLFLGLAPVRPVKDTTEPDFEKAALDIWNYKDDDLQPVQLKNLEKDLKKSYTTIWDIKNHSLLQLADKKFPEIEITKEGDGAVFYAGSDFGKRVERQWQGYTLKDIYAINPATGEKSIIIRDFKGSIYPSYTGKYLLLYADKQKGYLVYNSASAKLYKVASDIKPPLYDEENDVPDDPNPYGILKWMEDDKAVLLYDRYDVWKVDPENRLGSVRISSGRKNKIQYRYISLDRDEKYISEKQVLYFSSFDEVNKGSGIAQWSLDWKGEMNQPYRSNHFYRIFEKAKDSPVLLCTKENYLESPNVYSVQINQVPDTRIDAEKEVFFDSLFEKKLSDINTQQSRYLWGSAELFTWKAYTGKITEGILYKPEDFDPGRKYPMLVYFYERNNSTLNLYRAPYPTPSALNIPFFVSRGYIVFVPDIWYNTGNPGKSAYDYIISGTRALIRKGFIDSTKLGIQGQSWGGYQTAYLITQTHLFAAAWAGAPVVNMFSAYGGIRWESGFNRQMQYEKGQSRIGATIWERPDLYIENSPLFHLPKVKTPLVIMSNDADGAVPWYQGIEFFTAMRRLNKPVWLLSYNGEAHNLVERRNRKDIQIREQQYFDWLLKGDRPPEWITEGVPATLKGIDWGLQIK